MNKKTKQKKSNVPVTVVIPMRNAGTTVQESLKTVSMQEYPIKEIIVVDNISKDDSREIVRKFARTSDIPVRLLVQNKDKGVASSYNRGVKEARTQLVVFLTSDCALPSPYELGKLVAPLMKDQEILATHSTSVLPKYIWNKYNFWEKYFASRMVENRSSGMVLKFDCIRKDIFQKIGGFDEINFGGDGAIGGEDADLTTRLRKIGRIERTDAQCLHLHYISDNYGLVNMLKSRKMYARSAGRYLRKSFFANPAEASIFLIRPILAILPFMPGLQIMGVIFLLLYSLLYSRNMFVNSSTLTDSRILLIPVLNVFILYYELYWILQAFVTYKTSTV